MVPTFTIGIPTYNRAGFLRKSLASALAQTDEDVEVLVSDNASTDDTPEVVRQAGGKVRYLRIAKNIGATPNFVNLVEAAQGEYFAFLQDDDLIHRDFVRRARAAFSRASETVIYAGYAVQCGSCANFPFAYLNGPPFPLDWTTGEVQYLDGKVVAPLSFLISVAIPPVVAFRTNVLRKAMMHTDPECHLYNERIWLAAAAAEGTIAVEPWIAGVFYQHESQNSRLVVTGDPASNKQQLIRFAGWLCHFMEHWDGDWRIAVEKVFRTVSPLMLIAWFRTVHRLATQFTLQPVLGELIQIMRDCLPEDVDAVPHESKSELVTKKIARSLTPPLIWTLGGYLYHLISSPVRRRWI